MAEQCHPAGKVNLLKCRVCGGAHRNPACVHCGHSFCTRCIQDYWDLNKMNNGVCSCPHCGLQIPSRQQLIKNITREEETDTERCDSKRSKHAEDPLQVLNRPCSSAQTSGSSLCRRHNKPLDIYCCTEEQILCEQCISAEHTGHKLGLVSEERRRKQEELRNMQTQVKQILQQHEKKWEDTEKVLEGIQDEARQTEDYCESVIVGVIDSLQKHYLSVRELIGAQAEMAAAQVHTSQQTLQVKMEEMKKSDAELERLAQAESHIHFLQKWPSVRPPCDHLHPLREDSEDHLRPFEVTKRAVEQLGRQLEEFCDREFAAISQTADSGGQQESAGETAEDDMQQRSHGVSAANGTLTEVKVEPKTREQFLQYACELSLDPRTAHEDLTISRGDKEVMLSPQKCKSSPVRYPDKFLHRRQVLCREGLQAERCYYEIEVEGDKAEIALAYKGIDRKSRTKLSAFGGNEISWSLDRSTNYSVSYNSDSIQLMRPPSCRRIGVYLKFKEGTLSFYEVSDSMTFLYKVEAMFTEPLYPGFWLGDKCHIRICDLTAERGLQTVSVCLKGN